MSFTIEELTKIANDDEGDIFVFMGSNWVEDPAVTDGVFPGHRYAGEILCANCNDLFYWAVADAEHITEETLQDFNKAIDDCAGNKDLGAWLYCSRIRKMRPQGAAYSYIPEELWPLFDACGPERPTDSSAFGNPFKRGEYGR